MNSLVQSENEDNIKIPTRKW